jgi:hypothetical protein
MAGPSE